MHTILPLSMTAALAPALSSTTYQARTSIHAHLTSIQPSTSMNLSTLCQHCQNSSFKLQATAPPLNAKRKTQTQDATRSATRAHLPFPVPSAPQRCVWHATPRQTHTHTCKRHGRRRRSSEPCHVTAATH
ncbi:hypothetical protein K439DRAFT_1066245 [Ramaria rubella]|nr:hypothetical protein K439DRAFT_1066245 [Ramaria rubella]